jgi:PKD repeat protein
MVQLVTWNDYEEGSSLESGIDNCLSISVSLAGTQLRWSLSGTGSESTVDHYRVYVSLDGQNLMKVADVATGVYALDLASFSLKAANYTFYVQAYGKPSFHNKMSNAVGYAVANTAPTASLSLSKSSGVAPVALTASISATDADGSIAFGSIDFGDGTVISGTSASHTYATAGAYLVRATVTDNLGATASAMQTVTVSPQSVTILTPSDQAAVGSPARIRATASSGAAINAMKIYVDGISSYEVLKTTELDTGIVLAPGTRRVTVQAWDAAGAVFKSTIYVQVVAASVTILSPSEGATADSPVRITAQATSAATVTAMKVYVDDMAQYEVANAASLDAALALAPGAHRITVQAWDSSGAVFNSSVNVVVNPYVTIFAPYDYSSMSSPVRVSAAASSSAAVNVMRVIVDNKQVYESANASLLADIRMSAGSHRLTVQAVDAAGVVFSRSISISVKKSSCGSSSLLIYGGRTGC